MKNKNKEDDGKGKEKVQEESGFCRLLVTPFQTNLVWEASLATSYIRRKND